MIDSEIVQTHNGYGWTSTVPNQITVALLDWLKTLEQTAPLILDIGAGLGVGTLPLLEAGATVIALDLEESHLVSIRQEAERRSIAERLTTAAGKFPGTLHFEQLDAVHCSNVLHFLSGSEIETGARKLYEWLKPGGKIFLQVGTIFAGHIRRLLPEFEERRRSGLKWAGETHSARDYVAAEFRDATPKFMNYLDEAPLMQVFEASGFQVDRSWYYSRTGIPDAVRFDGREHYGMVMSRSASLNGRHFGNIREPRDEAISPRQTNPRHEIISLLRGQVACPLIASLAELGIAERMLEGCFQPTDFSAVCNQALLESCFQYLQSIGLIEDGPESGKSVVTDIGRTVFNRAGAFLLLSSYREYFDSFSGLLTGSCDGEIAVNRRLNVSGSGSLHTRKFFPSVKELLGSNPPDTLLDLGCGDGAFLEYALRNWPSLEIAALDLSPVAIQAALSRLRNIGVDPKVTVVENAAHVESWAARLSPSIQSGSLTISIWFVVHEFSEGKTDTVVRFFQSVRECLPNAGIILGEIVSIPSEVLARDRQGSIAPEFLLFHKLSGQGVLSWRDWLGVLDEIPYQLASERLFDLVEDYAGHSSPTSFIWHLRPVRKGAPNDQG